MHRTNDRAPRRRLPLLTLASLAALLTAAACSQGAPASAAGEGEPRAGGSAGVAAAASAAPAGSPTSASTASGAPAAERAAGTLAASPSAVAAAVPEGGAFTGSPADIQRLVGYHRTLRLTPEQEAVRVAALSALPAPCCSNFSAATCCCECNMARATWGLAKHLIAEQGQGEEEVREAVASWHRTINPDGFSGSACFNGGCGRAFRHDGCGGMVEGELIF